jgi:hypothetical protein
MRNKLDMRTLRNKPSTLEKHFTDLKQVKINTVDYSKHSCVFCPVSDIYNQYIGYLKCQICSRFEYINGNKAKKLFPNLSLYWSNWIEYINVISLLNQKKGKKPIRTFYTKRYYDNRAYQSDMAIEWRKYTIGVD